MNYRKSLLSLVAVMALSNTVIADSNTKYVPLTSKTVDSAFVLFGVNGFNDGTHGGSSGASSFSGSFTGVIEETTYDDELSVNGVYVNAPTNTGPYFMTLQALKSDTALNATFSIAIDPSTLVYAEEEAEYTMYLKIEGVITAKIDYKSSLEGKTIEIIRNGSPYNIVLSEEYTWSNPGVPNSGLSTTAASDTDLRTITDVLDFDFDNNPVTPADYNTSFRDDTASGFVASTAGAAHFYHYDAKKVKWNVWNRHSVANANEFTKFLKGHSYWGRMDANSTDGSLVSNASTGHAGLVLGEPDGSVSTSFVDEDNVSILAEGWNMLSFNENQPYIRRATTGLRITAIDAGDADTITITDSTGQYSVTSAALVDDTIDTVGAVALNKQIESLKLRNLLPANFNVRAFGSETAGELILISDKKFSVDLTGAAGTVTTLAGQSPYVDGVRTAVIDLDANRAAGLKTESVYGEYSMLLEVLIGTGTAAQLDFIANTTGSGGTEQSAKLIFGQNGVDNTAVALAADDTTSIGQMATAITNIIADDVFDGTQANGTAIHIDSGFEGTNDLVLVSSDEPFFVKDATYTRAFTYSGAAGSTLKVSGKVAYDVATLADRDAFVEDITEEADSSDTGTAVYAAAGTAVDTIVAVTTNSDLFDLKDVAHTTTDYLEVKSETADIAKGAVKAVYSLDSVIDVPLNWVSDTIVTITTIGDGNVTSDANDTFAVTVNNYTTATPIELNASTGITDVVDTQGELLALYDAIVAETNRLLTVNDVHGSASHAYEINATAATALAATTALGGVITVTGVDINNTFSIAFAEQATGNTGTGLGSAQVAAATGDNNITMPSSPDLSSDLKANAVYSPNYAVYGPMYTLRNDDGGATGYDVTSILEATTDMDTASDPTGIEWGGIDMTRNENDWFENNEFDTYRINSTDGYWVRLEDKSTNDINISTPTLNPSYTYYFSRDGTTTPAYVTTNVINSGDLEVVVTGLSDSAAASVYAIIGGEELQLKNTSGSTSYTATISDYSMSSFSESTTPVAITIRAVDGKGKTLTSSSALSFDYVKPTDVAVVSKTSTGAVFSAVGTDVEKIYLFNNYIPEYSTEGDELLSATVDGSNRASFDICSSSTFGNTSQLRVVAVDGDGTIGNANISDALGYTYAATLKGAHVITHTQGDDDASKVVGSIYNDSCAVASTPTLYSENNGVELTSLATLVTAKLSFVPISGEQFDKAVAWTSAYQVDGGGTDIIQIEATGAYVGKTFYVEYGGKLYTQTFPTQVAAGASISGAPILLTEIVGAENSSL